MLSILILASLICPFRTIRIPVKHNMMTVFTVSREDITEMIDLATLPEMTIAFDKTGSTKLHTRKPALIKTPKGDIVALPIYKSFVRDPQKGIIVSFPTTSDLYWIEVRKDDLGNLQPECTGPFTNQEIIEVNIEYPGKNCSFIPVPIYTYVLEVREE